MGRPKGIWTPQVTRNRIRTSALARRLEDHALGRKGVEMSATQVQAALGILKKTLPDLSSTDLNIEGQLGTYDVSDKPISAEQWEAEASNYLGAATGTPKTTN